MNVASFFAGCGGLDLGFEQAGFNVVWANEFDVHCCDTYVRNHPNTKLVIDDICNIKPNTIPDCDGFIGGPPCQSWSIGGNQKGLEDKRGQLFVKYIELIMAKKPKFFVIENVKGILDDKFRDVFECFLESLENAGYDVKWSLLDAVNYSIPQNRERVFIVGFRKELFVKYQFPRCTCVEPITLENAIGDIQENPILFSSTKVDDSYKLVNNKRKLQNHDVLNTKFGPFYYRGNRRRGWLQPSFTINATADYIPLHPSSPKMVYFGRENWSFQKEKMSEYRRMSVRECARIQSFPDDFIFDYDNIKNAYRMIGNAVPPRLGKEIAKSVHNALLYLEVSTDKLSSEDNRNATVLVGYYKNDWHKQLIIANKIYYVRSDGRKGSIFKEDCSVCPRFLLLHHGDNAEIFELNAEEPILVDSSFLRTMGFETSGETYLSFSIKNIIPKSINEFNNNAAKLHYNKNNYFPYFTTIENIIE